MGMQSNEGYWAPSIIIEPTSNRLVSNYLRIFAPHYKIMRAAMKLIDARYFFHIYIYPHKVLQP